MSEIKINEFMEIHYDIDVENNSFSHAFGCEVINQPVLKAFRVVVYKDKQGWIDITHALPENFYNWCEGKAQEHLEDRSFVSDEESA